MLVGLLPGIVRGPATGGFRELIVEHPLQTVQHPNTLHVPPPEMGVLAVIDVAFELRVYRW